MPAPNGSVLPLGGYTSRMFSKALESVPSETENMKRPTTRTYIQTVITNLLKKQKSRTRCLHIKFYQTFTEELTYILFRLFQNMERMGQVKSHLIMVYDSFNVLLNSAF